MTDWLLGLVPQYGVTLLFACTFVFCLALPIPASMLMAGGFAAAGELSLTGAGLAAWAGDQTGYFAGCVGGTGLMAWPGKRAAPLANATDLLARNGGMAVYLTRWLLSALGPYINLAAGAAGMAWARFTVWGVAGEATWVALYVGLGYYFTGNIAAASTMAVSVLGFLAAGAVAFALGDCLLAILRADKAGQVS